MIFLDEFQKKMLETLILLLSFFGFSHNGHTAQWEIEKGFRYKPLQISASEKVGFTKMSPTQTRIDFTNSLARSRWTTNQVYLNGSGVAAADVDGDGKVDVFFGGLDSRSRLFRNLGEWRFEDVTKKAGLEAASLSATGVAFADIDGDFDFDLIINTIGQGTHLFTNDGRGNFLWRTKKGAPNAGKGGMSMALSDVDGDGDLDLYLANYRSWTYRDHPRPKIRGKHIKGKPVVISFNGRSTNEPDLVGRFSLTKGGKIIENGEQDAFFLNDGGGRFRQVRFDDGAFFDASGEVWKVPLFDWGLSVMFRDMNGDGAPDLYVCNDFSAPDRIWLGDGKGHFQAMSSLDLRNTSRFSMGIDFADLDRDGHDDFAVMDMLSRDHHRRMMQMSDPPIAKESGDDLMSRPQFSRNTLYRNRGDGSYAEVAYWAKTHASEWSWAPVFIDVDLDGYEDLLVTNGHQRDALNADVRAEIEKQIQDPKLSRKDILLLGNLFDRLATPNVAFHNRGDFSFEEVGEKWGFNQSEVSHGMALADLDDDGDQDVLINHLGAPAGVFRNETSAGRVAVRLKGEAGNTAGVGAKIIFKGKPISQSQELILGGRYLSSDDPMRVFAATKNTKASLKVHWRSGKVSIVNDVRANRIYEIFEKGARNEKQKSYNSSNDSSSNFANDLQTLKPIFIDVSERLQHVHFENSFDDFFRQPMLSRGLSELGPGVAWTDWNEDGTEDLIIGSGRGGRMGIFINDQKGGFQTFFSKEVNPIQRRDQGGMATWKSDSKGVIIASGLTNYEDGMTSGNALSLAFGKGKSLSMKAWKSSVGPLAVCDFDGDGDIDVFVGGRVVAGQYPRAADSKLLINEKGSFKESHLNESIFKKVGMVSGALWSDLESDGFAELILACEWGAIRIFENDHGNLKEATQKWGLAKWSGW